LPPFPLLWFATADVFAMQATHRYPPGGRVTGDGSDPRAGRREVPAAWQQILQAGDGPRSRSALLTAFGAFDLCGEPARIRRGGKSRELAFIAVDAGPPCDLDEELEHPRVFLLGEQIDLQVEMIATLRDARLSILGDEDEGREKDRFEGDGERQERERKRIEARRAAGHVPTDPCGEPDYMRPHEPHRSAESGDPIRQSIADGFVRVGDAVDLEDRLDVACGDLLESATILSGRIGRHTRPVTSAVAEGHTQRAAT